MKNWSSFELGTARPALEKAIRSSSLSNFPLWSRSILLKSDQSALSVSFKKIRKSASCQDVSRSMTRLDTAEDLRPHNATHLHIVSCHHHSCPWLSWRLAKERRHSWGLQYVRLASWLEGKLERAICIRWSICRNPFWSSLKSIRPSLLTSNFRHNCSIVASAEFSDSLDMVS